MFAITPNTLSTFMNSISKYIVLLSLLLIGIAAFLIIFIENDYYQGISFKIMFIHVPAAWLSLAIFLAMGIGSIVLVSGSIWGNLTWGAYWVWDARLTSMLILAFIYLGHILLLYSFEHFQKADFAASILAIIGMVNLPIVKFSVDWWTTLHQGSSVLKIGGPSMTNDYLITLLVSFLGIFMLTMYWFSNIFYIIIEKRKIERSKLLND